MHTHLITVVFRGSKCVSVFTQLPVEVEECVAQTSWQEKLGILLFMTYNIYDIMHAVIVVELHVRIEQSIGIL